MVPLSTFESAQERLYVLWRLYVSTPKQAVVWAESLQRLNEQEGPCEYLNWLMQTWPDLPRAPPIKQRRRDHHFAKLRRSQQTCLLFLCPEAKPKR